MSEDKDLVEVLHGLDAARRVAWAKAYAQEDTAVELLRQLVPLQKRVNELTSARLAYVYALHYLLRFKDEDGVWVHSSTDWLEAIVGGAESCSRLYLHNVTHMSRERIDKFIDLSPDVFATWVDDETGAAMVALRAIDE